jgi:uncharacterized damage-inducible protein DinB
MNNINSANSAILTQLIDVLIQLDSNQYKQSLKVLSNSSVGQHVRHVIEFYQTVLNGVSNKVIDYDARQRDLQTETDLNYALQQLKSINNNFSSQLTDLNLSLMVDFGGEKLGEIPTSLFRELVYLIEHTIHHMAIIKIALQVAFQQIEIPTNFGVAFSTIKYQMACELSA